MPLRNCDHCQEKVVVSHKDIINGETKVFCCHGCQTVYRILQENDLGEYYSLREGQDQSITQKNQKIAKFTFLDESSFRAKFVRFKNESHQFSFYIEGIHCAACLWILEKLPEINSDIIASKLNMSNSTLAVDYRKSLKLSDIAELILNLGYYPHPLLSEKDSLKLKNQEIKHDIIRIATAFFCTGNIMLFAYSNYLGADSTMRSFFDIFSGILFFPILFYCATPFYQNALGTFKIKKVSIDLPIVIALTLGGILSYISLLLNLSHIYFDTLSTLVFLILISRFLLKVSQHKSLNQENIFGFASHLPAKKIENGVYIETHASFLEKGDVIEVAPGETIPTDGIVLEGESTTNNALITGEIVPVKIHPGEEVFSGCINNKNIIRIKVSTTLENSELGKALRQIEQGWNEKTDIMRISDRVAKYFVSIQMLLALFVFIYFYYSVGFETAYIRALTLIIITCPCALGLTPPLTLTIALTKLAKNGILVKDEKVLERINFCKKIFFDKTGTLTDGKFKIDKWNSYSANRLDEERILFSLEKRSSHPIAKAVTEYITKLWQDRDESLEAIPFEDYEEIPGVGIKAVGRNTTIYEIRKKTTSEISSAFSVFKNDVIICDVFLKDQIIPSASRVLTSLRKNYKIHLLSGDQKTMVEAVAKELNFEPEKVYFSKTPNEKKDIIKENPDSIMVGDGANDAVAINSASVGIAVASSMDLSLRASHVFFNRSDSLECLEKLIITANESRKVIMRNIGFSLIFNLLGSYLAIVGAITPLLAAVLMPISSFIVLTSSLFTTKKMRNNT